jgi:YrbI family 3-deoxy-D-manno-octulosonate 8-phosphate phosphatase
MPSSENHRTAAIIPARGGSKGVPRKNVLPLCGKSLIAWTVCAAREAQLVDRVIVSTDDAEIAQVAERHGASIVWRPADISGDRASSESVLLHALDYMEEQEGYSPDILAFLQCTSPLTLAEDIDGTIAALIDGEADTALAVAPFHYFLWQNEGNDEAVGINHDKRVRLLRQERAPQFRETGAVYVMRTPGFKQARHRFFGKTVLHVVPGERCLEIDEPVDFRVAEVLLREREFHRRLEAMPTRISAIILDFDGVMTDNRVLVLDDGREMVACNRSDGLGLAKLREIGFPVLVLSTETNPVVSARCRKLGLACRQGIACKKDVMMQWLKEVNVAPESAAYVGNDVNDLECLAAAGCSMVVNDAYPAAKANARIVLENPGGRGAVREAVELILKKLEKTDDCHG